MTTQIKVRAIKAVQLSLDEALMLVRAKVNQAKQVCREADSCKGCNQLTNLECAEAQRIQEAYHITV